MDGCAGAWSAPATPYSIAPGNATIVRLSDAVRELGRKPIIERVGDDHRLGVDVVEDLDVSRPVLGQPRHDLTLGQLEMLLEKVPDVCFGPGRICAAQEAGDLARVVVPTPIVHCELVVVARLGILDQIDSNHDVVL